jgi:hypothetical protein
VTTCKELGSDAFPPFSWHRALRTEGFDTHRFPFARAAEAFELIDPAAEEALRVVLTY